MTINCYKGCVKVAGDQMKICCDYPGGNIKIASIGNGVVKIQQDMRDSAGWWFYWNFSVENPPEEEILFEFTNRDVVGPWGPAVSKNSIHWSWLGKEGFINHSSFKYKFNKEDKRVYFSFSLPYQLKHFESFCVANGWHKLFQRETLAISEHGRKVPLLKIGNPDAEEHIIFTCRHHSCESASSYLLEGLLTYLLNKNSQLLQDYLIHVIPFVDIDGVENGDQGKNRQPHDHNCDYIGDPVFKSTTAIMEYVRQLDKPPVVGFDFHCPYLWGGRNDFPFFVKCSSPVKEEIEKFGAFLSDVTKKKLALIK